MITNIIWVKITILFIALLPSIHYAQYVVNNDKINAAEIINKASEGFLEINKNLNIRSYDIQAPGKVDSLKLTLIYNPENIQKEYFISDVSNMLITNDTIIIVSRKENCLLLLDLNGKVKGIIGREGAGPKEFRRPSHIVNDFGNSRVQVFNHKFKYIRSMPLSLYPTTKKIAVNNNFLFANTNTTVPYVIETYSLKDLSFNESQVFHSKFGYFKDLNKYNQVYEMRVDISANYTIVSNAGLPYFYIFDSNCKPLYSVHLKLKAYERLKNDGPIPGFVMLMNDSMLDEDKFYIHFQNIIYIFDITKKAIIRVFAIPKTANMRCLEKRGNTLYIGSSSGEVYKCQINQ